MFKTYLDLLSASFLSADNCCRHNSAAAYKEQSQPKEDVAVVAGLWCFCFIVSGGLICGSGRFCCLFILLSRCLDKLNISTCPQGVAVEKGKNKTIFKNFFKKIKKSHSERMG